MLAAATPPGLIRLYIAVSWAAVRFVRLKPLAPMSVIQLFVMALEPGAVEFSSAAAMSDVLGTVTNEPVSALAGPGPSQKPPAKQASRNPSLLTLAANAPIAEVKSLSVTMPLSGLRLSLLMYIASEQGLS